VIAAVRTIKWYFDFISPYAWFGLHGLRRLGEGIRLAYQPVLFAGLLNHWGQKGPAEILPKRVWGYRSCVWWAEQNNIPFRVPGAHPFNPLPYLRLSIAAGNSAAAVKKIFEAVWTTGADPADPTLIASLAASLGVPLERIGDVDVKNSLREATEQAAREGVFGVPTLLIDGQTFWGNDAIDFAAAYLENPRILETEQMRRIETLPIGASRV
jgi:2-hydroxychromene-2-carboxylate isomerase